MFPFFSKAQLPYNPKTVKSLFKPHPKKDTINKKEAYYEKILPIYDVGRYS